VSACLAVACYDTTGTRISLRTPVSELDCRATADSVFEREGFVLIPNASGTDRLYTPHVTTPFGLRWAMAVFIADISGRDDWSQCKFELEAVSAVDENCRLNCPLTPQPGFNDMTRKMAGLLTDALRGRSEK
jgi:hypothetical protein